MAKVAIVGLGQMGVAVAYAMHKLGHEVFVSDSNNDVKFAAMDKLESLKVEVSEFNLHDEDLNVDLIMSMVPWWACRDVAKIASRHKIKYCDLGGNPVVSKDIRDNFSKSSQTFTDLGLAPGYANILGEHFISKSSNPQDLKICVGGLPLIPDNTLKYNAVFSIDGLVNEYIGLCDVISDYKPALVNALDGIETLVWKNGGLTSTVELYECFHTKGGLASTLETMQSKGIKNCCYKTIRHIGHADLIKFLRDECLQYGDTETLARLLKNACPPTSSDIVLISIEADDIRWQTKILGDDTWTAMQKSTAFPAAAVGAMMLDNQLGPHSQLRYSDVCISELWDRLERIDDTVTWRA